MPWLSRSGHLGRLSRALDRLGLTDTDWTSGDLLDLVDRHHRDAGRDPLPPDLQRDPVAVLVAHLHAALADITETPGARRRRAAEGRAEQRAVDAQRRADWAAAAAERAAEITQAAARARAELAEAARRRADTQAAELAAELATTAAAPSSPSVGRAAQLAELIRPLRTQTPATGPAAPSARRVTLHRLRAEARDDGGHNGPRSREFV